MNHDSILNKIFFDNITPTKYYRRLTRHFESYKRRYENVVNYLIDRFKDSESIKETIYRMNWHIEQRPVCKTCRKKLNLTINKKRNTIFPYYCSISCEMKDKDVMNKHNETCLKKYGSVNNSNKTKETFLKKYGCTSSFSSKELRQKAKETIIDRYGVEHPMKSKEIVNKFKKRNIAKENKLNYFEFWNFDDLKHFLDYNNLVLEYPLNILQNELEYYKNTKGKIRKSFKNSKIVKQYQQNILYKKEKELWQNEHIRNKLTDNRKKYLNKTELTNEDILDGFKRSGIYYSYSSFDPLLIKWFHEKYDSKICYDPCGGWGHRMLGSQNIVKYIYNDLSTSVYLNIKKIIDKFNINNVVTYNNDAAFFIPEEDYDVMFTCPPYYNVEIYENGIYNNIEEYYKLIDGIFNAFYKKKSCKTLGLVIREDLLQDKYIADEKYELSSNSRFKSNKKFKEYLYIFSK